MCKSITILIIGTLILLSTSRAVAQGTGIISLDSISGNLYDNDSLISPGIDITLWIRVTNNTGVPVTGVTNGFRIYSPESLYGVATWFTTSANNSVGSLGSSQFDLLWMISEFSTVLLQNKKSKSYTTKVASPIQT